jgi:hypothetical protein
MKITQDLIRDVKQWLGEAGLKFFSDLREKYGEGFGTACWMEGEIPHPVHFREGMQVRNKLRELTNGGWTSHEYDDNWAAVVKEALDN